MEKLKKMVPVPKLKKWISGTGAEYRKSAFTLVELIVVITILAILWTIGFLSFQSYNVFARDSVRLWNLKTLESGLWIMYVQSWNYAVPDNAVEVSSWSTVVILQWEVWKWVQRATKTSQWIWKDPLTEQLITYWTNKNYSKYELMTFLEWDEAMLSSPLNEMFAQDINKIKTLWSSVWLLTDENWTPIEKITSIQDEWKLDLATNTESYVAHFSDTDSQTFSGSTMNDLLVYKNQNQTNWCSLWFIKVPWNSEFNTTDFCVAKYEMSYIDANTPNSTWGWTDWNTTHYDSIKTAISIAWKYPIADITQWDAITECSKIWGHLITNNEWMTIARNVEAEPVNWKLKADWVTKYLPNGVSWDTVLGCNRTGWNTETKIYATTTWSPCDWWKNKLKLSNWEEIYDLSWNVWEYVNKANTIDWSDFNLWQTSFSWSSNWIDWDDNWIYDEIDMLKYGSKKLLWKINWMWSLYYSNWVASNIFVHGAGANNGSHAGVFALYLNRTSSNSDRGAGFRCAK